ncbi:uncharacterized protein ARB_08060 [Trichophyton benhamiae CBS 112371]|uniref:Uncharacterized protein n=1 Tax=Arthroderma benhamiae (strain ATCC MYA-4681 / CBS 112371) TaxID=663331 RepID=D4B5P7_ARTBC|nr:uncharacterized protein ARB_08060 [Trichophyton benhamiae CBS 112371]EFE29342.1 hypothetical protein ARB_08060 [Trichophyton benhamiae CBS 112371]
MGVGDGATPPSSAIDNITALGSGARAGRARRRTRARGASERPDVVKGRLIVTVLGARARCRSAPGCVGRPRHMYSRAVGLSGLGVGAAEYKLSEAVPGARARPPRIDPGPLQTYPTDDLEPIGVYPAVVGPRWYHGPKWYHFLVPFFRVPRIGPGPLQACSTDDLEPIGVDLAAAGPRVPRIGPGPLQACSTDDLEPIGVDLAAAGPRVPRIGPGPLQACSTDDLEPIGVDLAAAGPRGTAGQKGTANPKWCHGPKRYHKTQKIYIISTANSCVFTANEPSLPKK